MPSTRIIDGSSRIVTSFLPSMTFGDDVADLVVHQRHAGLVGRRAVGLRTRLMQRTSLGVSRVMSSSRSAMRCFERVERVLEAHDLLGHLRPDRLQLLRRREAHGHPLVQPALHDLLVGGAVLLVVGEHPEQRPRAALLAGAVGLAAAHDRRRDEVALRRRGVHDEPAAEQLADERLEDDRGREERLAPSRGCRSASRRSRACACQIGSFCQTSLCALPSKPSICSETSRL